MKTYTNINLFKNFRQHFYLLVFTAVLQFFTFSAYASPGQVEMKGARYEENKVIVEWTVIENLATQFYVLEKSTDGVNYIEVERLDPVLSSGVESEMHYSGTDNQVQRGTCYYRVKRVDMNGLFIYSLTIAFKHEGANREAFAELQVYPNPFAEHFCLKICSREEMKVDVMILSMRGRTVYRTAQLCEKGDNVISVDLSEFPGGGTFFIQVVNSKTGEKLYDRAIKKEM